MLVLESPWGVERLRYLGATRLGLLALLPRGLSITKTHAFHILHQEAASISSLKPALEAKGVPLYGLVHEERGTEEFRQYFRGPLFLDTQVSVCVCVRPTLP